MLIVSVKKEDKVIQKFIVMERVLMSHEKARLEGKTIGRPSQLML